MPKNNMAGINDNGAPKARDLNTKAAQDIINECIHMTVPEMEAARRDSNTSAIKVWILSIVINGINTGDFKGLNFLFDRKFGKVPDRLADANGEPLNFAMLMKAAAQKKNE